MKKIISFGIGIACTAMLFTACGGNSTVTSTEEASVSISAEAVTEPEKTETVEVVEEGYATASKEEVKQALEDDTVAIVDARINDAYNGWALDGVSRGGHIIGATDFSASAIKSTEKDAAVILKRSLADKQLDKKEKVIVYDAGGGEAQEVADYLAQNGVNNIALYDVNEWADDATLEMETYPNYQLIVPASVVKALIDGEQVDTFEKTGNDIKIAEVSWGSVAESGYLTGHVPGAFHINTDEFEPPTDTDPPEWRLGSDEVLIDLALKNGIVSSDTVVVTGAQPMAAYRFATILHYLGVEDVRVMNGGMSEWTEAGYEISTEEVVPQVATDFGAQATTNPQVIDTIEETKESLANDDQYELVDIRTWNEYIGKESGYSYQKIAGRIDGAIFAYAGEDGDSNSMIYYRNADWTMRNGYEILSMWKECGINLDDHLAFMCGSGWRAAETYWFGRVMGLDVSLFSDGWCGWSNDGMPFVVGDPAEAIVAADAATGSSDAAETDAATQSSDAA